MGMGGPAQGSAVDLLRFFVDRESGSSARVPESLGGPPRLSANDAKRTRVFTLAMTGMAHTINGRLYDAQRVDLNVPLGDVEIWEYRNLGTEPHPMHPHGGRCQVLSRSSAPSLAPEDTGWNDTVLVNAGETVRILTRFDAHPGVFVHHCHNLEHEDSGMMQNLRVEAPPSLMIERRGSRVEVSWTNSGTDWRLESSPRAGGDDWQPVRDAPSVVNGLSLVTLREPAGIRFYRLAKP